MSKNIDPQEESDKVEEVHVMHIGRIHIGEGYHVVRIVAVNGLIYFYCPEDSREYIKFYATSVAGLGELVKKEEKKEDEAVSGNP